MSGEGSLAQRYDALVCDLDGVVYRGPSPVPHAVETLRLVERPVVFATNNASRSPQEVTSHLRELGIDCVPGEWTDADTELIERKFRIYDLGTPPELQKFVCGKKLYNYDTLEPSERKLVL